MWPGETGRRERLDAALEAARRDPPPVHQGDLLADLPDLARQAPAHATLVVFHSAVLAYLPPERRADFAAAVRALDAVWLANEAPRVLANLPGYPRDLPDPGPVPAPFLLTRDARHPLAWADGHGSWLHWLPWGQSVNPG